MDCTEKCRKPVECTTCGRRKKPVGRDAPTAMANGLCDRECLGYREAPDPGHLWPNEKLPGEPDNEYGDV